MIRSLSLVNLYHKLSEKIDHNILRLCSKALWVTIIVQFIEGKD